MERYFFRRITITIAVVALSIGGGVCRSHAIDALDAYTPQPAGDEITVQVSQDWTTGEIVFTLQEPLTSYLAEGSRAEAPHIAAQKWRAHLPDIISRVLRQIPLGGDETVFSRLRLMKGNDAALQSVRDLITRTYIGFSADFAYTQAEYRFALYPDIVSLFPSSLIRPVAARHEWVASNEYSGIVIVANERLPIHGTEERAFVRPALFPSIYDTQLRVVMESDMVESDTMRLHGIMGYDTEYDAEEWKWRVGEAPLLVYARAVRGREGHDIIINDRDAVKILGREHNRRLIKEGRIICIIRESNFKNVLTYVYN